MELKFRTYAFYDEQGRRLSIFGYLDAGNSMRIYAIPCSLKDRFSKSVGLVAHALSDKITATIPVKGDFPKREFLGWCRANYQKPYFRRYIIDERVVKRGNKRRVLSTTKRLQKLSEYL